MRDGKGSTAKVTSIRHWKISKMISYFHGHRALSLIHKGKSFQPIRASSGGGKEVNRKSEPFYSDLDSINNIKIRYNIKEFLGEIAYFYSSYP